MAADAWRPEGSRARGSHLRPLRFDPVVASDVLAAERLARGVSLGDPAAVALARSARVTAVALSALLATHPEYLTVDAAQVEVVAPLDRLAALVRVGEPALRTILTRLADTGVLAFLRIGVEPSGEVARCRFDPAVLSAEPPLGLLAWGHILAALRGHGAALLVLRILGDLVEPPDHWTDVSRTAVVHRSGYSLGMVKSALGRLVATGLLEVERVAGREGRFRFATAALGRPDAMPPARPTATPAEAAHSEGPGETIVAPVRQAAAHAEHRAAGTAGPAPDATGLTLDIGGVSLSLAAGTSLALAPGVSITIERGPDGAPRAVVR